MARKPKSNDKPPPESAARPKGHSPRTRRAPTPPPEPPPEPPPDVNGSVEPEPIAEPPEFRRGNCRVASGVLASEVPRYDASYLWAPWIPSGCLTLVVGQPQTGKSCYGAALCSLAKRPAILPGNEEDLSTMLLPRLIACGADLRSTLLLSDRAWTMPGDRSALLDALRDHRSDLLWIDPIDSYVGDVSENDGPSVRAALEALARIARDLRIPVVCARHPGKAAENLCPGSRQWRAVPRVILQMIRDNGPPERRIISCVRHPYRERPTPHYYMLMDDGVGAPRWQIHQAVDESVLASLGVDDPETRWKIDESETLIRALLEEGEMLAIDVYAEAERLRLAERTVRYAARRIGVVIRREGAGREHRVWWGLPTPATPAE